MKKIVYTALIFISLAFMISCQKQPSMDDWSIDIGIRNVGTNVLDDASVAWGEFWFRAGYVAPSTEAVHVGFDRPIPETVTVYYSLPDAKKVEKTVTVKSAIPKAAYKDKDISVMFDVNSNTDEITVKILHFVEKDGYNQLVPFE
jgi:hypothetical protein